MRRLLGLLVVAAVPAVWAWTAGSSGPAAQAGDDATAASNLEFALRDHHGQVHALDDVDEPLVVVAFVGCECPLVRQYLPRLEKLAVEYAPRGVGFVAIDSNVQDSLDEIGQLVQREKLSFAILKDPDNQVADQFGAERTPEVFVLDAGRRIRYRGRIDDQYGVGIQRPKPTREDLRAALDDLLAKREVAVPRTTAAGCLIGRVPRVAPSGDTTYTKDIAPILAARCVECHRAGEVAPFPLTSYDEVVGWAESIVEVVHAGRMPPWFADPQYGEFLNAGILTDEEKATIDRWVANGAPEGDPADLPPPPKFTEGWALEKPDLILPMTDKPVPIPAEGVLEYQYFTVDPGFKEDKWIWASEARPGNRGVVHHILIFVQRPNRTYLPGLPGELMSAYAPGMKPTVAAREDMALRFPAGAKIVFQVHYTPNGRATEDLSYVGLCFRDESQVKYEVKAGMAINLGFAIPPHADNYEVTAGYRFKKDTLLLGVNPHMHLRGKSFRYEVTYPDGTREIIMDCPRFDFGWQIGYQYAEPRPMPKGTRLLCTAHYDNSENNPSNPNPNETVRFGDQTFEEMMIGWFFAATKRE